MHRKPWRCARWPFAGVAFLACLAFCAKRTGRHWLGDVHGQCSKIRKMRIPSERSSFLKRNHSVIAPFYPC